MGAEHFITCFANWRHSKKIYRAILVLTLYLATLDTYTDWGFYIDVVSMRPGLVYGYITNDVIIPLFVTTVLGSILYILEMVLIFCQLFGKQIELISFDTLIVVFMWFDVIPHLIINSFVAACHEYSVSYFQLLRTAISLSAMIIRFIATVVEYCLNYPEKKDEDKTGFCFGLLPCGKKVAYRIVTLTGFIIQLLLASLLFQFTYIQTYSGRFQFHVPRQVFGSHINPERYFNTVNIFLSLGIVNGDYRNQYMNIASLYHVMYSQRYGMTCDVRLSVYKAINSPYNIGFHFNKKFMNLEGQNIVNDECWNLLLKTNVITNVQCAELKNHYILTTSYIFHIKYLSPDSTRQFGIIKYQSLRAIYPDKYKNVKIRLKYFASDNGGFLSTVLESSFNKTWKFYNLHDLYSVRKLWKTGYAQCDSNALEHPIYVRSKFKL